MCNGSNDELEHKGPKEFGCTIFLSLIRRCNLLVSAENFWISSLKIQL